jgi:hypothetical protein
MDSRQQDTTHKKEEVMAIWGSKRKKTEGLQADRVVSIKRASDEGLIPCSYQSLFRLSSNPEWSDCFVVLGTKVCVDVEAFYKRGREKAQERAQG